MNVTPMEAQDICYAFQALQIFCNNYNAGEALTTDLVVEGTIAWRGGDEFQWNVGRGELSRIIVCHPDKHDGMYAKIIDSNGQFDEELTNELNNLIREFLAE